MPPKACKRAKMPLACKKCTKYTREHLFTLFPTLRLKFPRFQSLETSAHRRFFVNMSLIFSLIFRETDKFPIENSVQNRVQRYYIFLKYTILYSKFLINNVRKYNGDTVKIA